MIIIEAQDEAHEPGGPFRVYATQEEFIRLATQCKEAARLVKIGWVELDPTNPEHKPVTKPQSPEIQQWIRGLA